MMIKKVLCIILICAISMFVLVNVFSMLTDTQVLMLNVKTFQKNNGWYSQQEIRRYIATNIVNIAEHIVSILVGISAIPVCVLYMIGKNEAQYTYEEYKAKMDEKKALKKEAQKEKLKQKLNELEKGD